METPGTCINERALDIVTSSFNLGFDPSILLLLPRVIWKLQMSLRRKLETSFLFSIGIMYESPLRVSPFLRDLVTNVTGYFYRACVGAAGRLWSIITIDYHAEVTYRVSAEVAFALMEATSILIIFCIPAIPKMFKDSRIISRIGDSLKQSSNNSAVPTLWPHPRITADTLNTYQKIAEREAIPLQDLRYVVNNTLEASH